MFQKLSASKLPIAAACPGAFALEAHALPESEWAARGTAIHRFIDTCFRHSRDIALAELEDDEKLAVFCSKIPLHEITAHFGGEPRTEVQFAYNPETNDSAELEPSEDVPPGYLGGKVDGHRVSAYRVLGADWKTGFVRVAAPLQNLQLRAYALMLARRYELERVEFAVVDIDEEGFPFVRNAVFEEMDLDAAREDVRRIMGAVATARASVGPCRACGGSGGFVDRGPDPVNETCHACGGSGQAPLDMRLQVGDHCRYCEALPSCPAFVGTTQALVPHVDRVLETSPERLGELWVQADALGIMLERLQGAIRFQVEQRGLVVPLPTGKVLRAIQVPSRTLSGKITLEVMRDLKMEPAFLTAAKVSFTGIEAACGDRAPEVLAEIEKRKGITTKTFTQMRPMKPKKEK